MKSSKTPVRLSRMANGRLLSLSDSAEGNAPVPAAVAEAAKAAEPKAAVTARAHAFTPRQETSAIEIAAFVGRMLAARRRGPDAP
jgi:hypothetical protein